MQFTLRRVFMAVTIIAIYCGLIFATPNYIGLLALAVWTGLLPGVIVSGILYTRGPDRAFWIGCASAGLIVLNMWVMSPFHDLPMIIIGQLFPVEDFDWYPNLAFAAYHALIFANGCIVVACRRLFVPGDASDLSAPRP